MSITLTKPSYRDIVDIAVINDNSTKVEDAVNTLESTLTDTAVTASAAKSSAEIANNRIDEIISEVIPEAEVADIRVGYNGDTYSTAGEAVRSQIQDLRNDVQSYIGTEAVNGLLYDDNNYLYLTANGSVISEGVYIKGGGGGGGGGSTTLKVTPITPSPITALPTDSVIIQYTYSCYDEDGDPVGGNYVWKRENTVISSGRVEQGLNEIDLTKYCSVGTQALTLTVTDDSSHKAIKYWSAQIVDIDLTSDFNDHRYYEHNQPITFNYIPSGAIVKTIHFILNGEELPSVQTEVSGETMYYTLPAHDHGAYTLEYYLTATVNDTPIETEHAFKNIVWYNSNSVVPIISSIYTDRTINTRQYNTTNITYYVYDPNTSTPEVEKYVDGVKTSTQIMSTTYDVWAFSTSEVGEHELKLKCGTTEVIFTVAVTKLDINVDPVTDGLDFDFNPVGYSNNDENRLWKDKNNPSIQMTVSDNFDWVNGGYQIDNDGSTYFCIKKGTTASINYNLFEEDLSKNGAECKIIFKTANVLRAGATILDCTSTNDKAGLLMNVHEAYLTTSSGDQLYIPYSEEDIVEFEYNINAIGENDEAVIMSYEDGVFLRPIVYAKGTAIKQYNPVELTFGSKYCDIYLYRMKVYNHSLDDSSILKNFIADARSATEILDRYTRNQIYNENKQLTPESLAAACPDLRIIKIECPHFTNDKKDYVKDTTVECIYSNGDPTLDNWKFENCYHAGQGTTSNTYGYAGRNIDIIMCFDGKSTPVSTKYIPLDPDYKTILTLGDGEQITDGTGKVSLTRTSVPNNWFNIKVNIASSENANNALLQKRFNDYIPYKSVATTNNPKVKNSMEFQNCVVFLKENDEDLSTHREFNDTEWHFYAIGNIGDSKKTDSTRVNDVDDLAEFVIEISDNTLPNSTFDTGIYDEQGNIIYPIDKSQWCEGNTKYDALQGDGWDDTYEFRYEMGGDTKDGMSTKPSSEEQEAQRLLNKQVWRDFYAWVVTSTDEEFVDELENWCIKDSILYWYLFTERYEMVDNRAKNTFWHYGKCSDGKYRFDMWDYDNDTACGIDNNGALTITYGKEDIDLKTDGSYVFNAGDSVFWRRIRNLFANDLNKLYQQLESKNCWNSNLFINEFDNWQLMFPEELWRVDSWRKYYRTYFGMSYDNSIKKAADVSFLTKMMNGRKKYQRRQFERDQASYMGSKHLSTTFTTDNEITIRCVTPQTAVITPNYDLHITPYSDMYVSVVYGNTSPMQQRAKAGQEYTFVCPYETMSTTQVLIYNASKIQDIGDISTSYIEVNNFSQAEKLQQLIIGNSTEGYENSALTSITLCKNGPLQYLDLTNCTALIGTLDLSFYQDLETVKLEGTKLNTITFADNGKIENAYLPTTLTGLTINNNNYLSNLNITNNILTNLEIHNSPIVDSLSIVQNNISTLQKLYLYGIDWSLDDTILIESILNLPDTLLTGKLRIPAIDFELLTQINDKYPDLQVIVNGVAKICLTYLNYDYTKLYQYIADQGSAAIDPIEQGLIETPTRPYTEDTIYTYNKWSNLQESVTKSYKIVAEYIANYRIQFFDGNGTNVHTEWADQNTGIDDPVVSKKITTPVKDSTAQYNYVYKGWDKTFNNITSPLTITAQFDEYIRQYRVSFYNGNENDRELLESHLVEYGGYAVYSGSLEDIKKKVAGEYSEYYECYGWNPSLDEPITGVVDYYAQFVFIGYIEDDWATIASKVSAGIEDYDYGARKKFEVTYTYNGKSYTDTVEAEVVGKDHDELESTSDTYRNGAATAGLTFRGALSINRNMNTNNKTYDGDTNSNAGGWMLTDSREWLNGSFYSVLPSDIKLNIKSVKKYSDFGYSYTTKHGGIKSEDTLNSTYDKIWLPSLQELAIATSDNCGFVWNQGTAYPIFTDNLSRKYVPEGSTTGITYWTRSSYFQIGLPYFFGAIGISGIQEHSGSSNNNRLYIYFCI